MYLFSLVVLLFINLINYGQCAVISSVPVRNTTTELNHNTLDMSCTCAIFLTGQFVKGSTKQPSGYPPILSEPEETFPCNNLGTKQCTSKCLENLAQYLPNSAKMICGSVDRDIYKERAFLFVKNCNSVWTNTRMSGGQEYCCKNNEYYKCPKIAA